MKQQDLKSKNGKCNVEESAHRPFADSFMLTVLMKDLPIKHGTNSLDPRLPIRIASKIDKKCCAEAKLDSMHVKSTAS